jgi:LmeA-like phospholipid-binding
VKTKRRFLRDPLSVVLILIIVVALVVAGLIGAELYARRVADNKVAQAAECVTQDNASVSFGVTPPFLWQHITGHYTDISIRTAGNQIKEAKGMTADVDIYDVDLHGTANSKGTIGALDATLTWTSDGIKETVQDALPVVGNLVNSVTTNPNDGTIQFKGPLGLGSVTVKPQVVNNGLSLQVVDMSGLGMPFPKESVQPALDTFTSQLTNRYPLGIHPDRVQVTGTSVVGHFSTRNATIPSQSQDPCFASL